MFIVENAPRAPQCGHRSVGTVRSVPSCLLLCAHLPQRPISPLNMQKEILDINLFIEEVKIRPILWYTNHEDYKDRVKRQQAWENICELMIENFTESTRSEKNLIVQRTALKWRNLKDNYIRSIRKQAENSHTNKYVYAEQLSFINLNLAGMYQSVLDKYESDSQQNGEDDDPLLQPETKFLPEPTAARVTLPKFKRSDRQEVKNSDRQDAKVMKFDDSPSVPEQDEDEAFFNSLMPSVRRLNADQKLDFRIEVLNILKQLKRK